jgi:hypothetical protein
MHEVARRTSNVTKTLRRGAFKRAPRDQRAVFHCARLAGAAFSYERRPKRAVPRMMTDPIDAQTH